ncbi:hypothetical protein AVEN_202695-1 [Araneus ventricosus]|uniref:DUF4817 domain-containing protein n=1 Tax=Araneus ventricosus TaxID=182803 RepID=A0A4Y2U427_ARAVE|nr:hypothetical protein AVEN_202695-1 [Araneus ventricosus]
MTAELLMRREVHTIFLRYSYSWTGLSSNSPNLDKSRIFETLHFGFDRNAKVPDKKTILLWVRNFRRTRSALKRKPPGRPCSVRTSQEVEAVRQAVHRSPQCSVHRHATPIGISDRCIRRILHLDLKFHPYKMMVVQEIKDRVWANRRASSEAILQNVPRDVILLSGDEADFHLSGCVNKQNFR